MKVRLIAAVVDDERGVTLVETMVAMIITTILLIAFYGFFFTFGDEVTSQERRARTLEAARPVVAELVLELRQAVDLDGDGAVVESLNSAWDQLDLVFYSDRLDDAPGPERYRYHLGACVANRCELLRSVTVADVGSGPNWTYTGIPSTRVALVDVLDDGPEPLFRGASFRTGTEITTTVCGGATPCDFELLRIRLRVDPRTVRSGRAVVDIQEDVRFRNDG